MIKFENTTKGQQRAIRAIEQRDSENSITRIMDGGMGHICVDWVEYDGRQFQALINEAGQHVGFDREIWC